MEVFRAVKVCKTQKQSFQNKNALVKKREKTLLKISGSKKSDRYFCPRLNRRKKTTFKHPDAAGRAPSSSARHQQFPLHKLLSLAQKSPRFARRDTFSFRTRPAAAKPPLSWLLEGLRASCGPPSRTRTDLLPRGPSPISPASPPISGTPG